MKELMGNLRKFCRLEKQTIWLIIDQENVFERKKIIFRKEEEEFKNELLNGQFFDAILHGFSENDEMLSLFH